MLVLLVLETEEVVDYVFVEFDFLVEEFQFEEIFFVRLVQFEEVVSDEAKFEVIVLLEGFLFG